jgi:hypothetical protein
VGSCYTQPCPWARKIAHYATKTEESEDRDKLGPCKADPCPSLTSRTPNSARKPLFGRRCELFLWSSGARIRMRIKRDSLQRTPFGRVLSPPPIHYEQRSSFLSTRSSWRQHWRPAPGAPGGWEATAIGGGKGIGPGAHGRSKFTRVRAAAVRRLVPQNQGQFL